MRQQIFLGVASCCKTYGTMMNSYYELLFTAIFVNYLISSMEECLIIVQHLSIMEKRDSHKEITFWQKLCMANKLLIK